MAPLCNSSLLFLTRILCEFTIFDGVRISGNKTESNGIYNIFSIYKMSNFELMELDSKWNYIKLRLEI